MSTAVRTPNAGRTYYEALASGSTYAEIAASSGRSVANIKTSAQNYALKNLLDVTCLRGQRRGTAEIPSVVSELVVAGELSVAEIAAMTGVTPSVVQRARTAAGLVKHRVANPTTLADIYEAVVEALASDDFSWLAVAKTLGIPSGRLVALKANKYAENNKLPTFDVPAKSARLPKDLETVRDLFSELSVDELVEHFGVGKQTITNAGRKLGVIASAGPRGGARPVDLTLGSRLAALLDSGKSMPASILASGVGLSVPQATRLVKAYRASVV